MTNKQNATQKKWMEKLQKILKWFIITCFFDMKATIIKFSEDSKMSTTFYSYLQTEITFQ